MSKKIEDYNKVATVETNYVLYIYHHRPVRFWWMKYCSVKAIWQNCISNKILFFNIVYKSYCSTAFKSYRHWHTHYKHTRKEIQRKQNWKCHYQYMKKLCPKVLLVKPSWLMDCFKTQNVFYCLQQKNPAVT